MLSCTRGTGQACCNGRCNGVQRGSTCAPVALVPARARARTMIIIMRCPAPAIFEGRPAPLLPYCEARRSERAVRSAGQRRGTEKGRGEGAKREKRERKEEECTCINFAPRHAAHTRSLHRHGDFRNTRFLLGPYLTSSIGASPFPPVMQRESRRIRDSSKIRDSWVGLQNFLRIARMYILLYLLLTSRLSTIERGGYRSFWLICLLFGGYWKWNNPLMNQIIFWDVRW